MRAQRLILFSTTVLLLGAPFMKSYAIPAEWSATELHCAKGIGIDLEVRTDPSSPTYERHLAWLSDVIVYAQVKEIRHDIRGNFHTQVALEIVSTMKGTVEGSTVYVDLVSGPDYVESSGVMGKSVLYGEPSFKEGETVLLFLTTGTWELPGNPFALSPGHYRLVDDVKWLVVGDLVAEEGEKSHEHSLKWINGEISLAVEKQSASCETGE